MKYKVGDKVRIRKDLVVDKSYTKDPHHDFCIYVKDMKDVAEKNHYIFTIEDINSCDDRYTMLEDEEDYNWTEEMIEGLVEEKSIDREKFEGWMRELGRLNGGNDVWKSFDSLTYLNPDESEKGFEEALKTVADYLFDTKKKMTKAEIEAELGYEIEIVEE